MGKNRGCVENLGEYGWWEYWEIFGSLGSWVKYGGIWKKWGSVLGGGEVWERCGSVYEVSVEGVGKCVGVWGRVQKSGGGVKKCGVPTNFSTPPVTLLHTSPNSSSQPSYPSSNTSPYSPILTLSSTPYQNFSLFLFIAKLVEQSSRLQTPCKFYKKISKQKCKKSGNTTSKL